MGWGYRVSWLGGLLILVGVSCSPTEPLSLTREMTSPRRLLLEVDFAAASVETSDLQPEADFHDVAAQRGVDFRYYNDAQSGNLFLPEALGGGAAAVDFDLDGWCDLYLTNGRTLPATQPQSEHRDAVYRNLGGRYADVTGQSFLAEFDYSHGCAVADVNADGFDDLLVANLGLCRLFLNQGDGTFVQHPAPL
jgi:hypothetical protein